MPSATSNGFISNIATENTGFAANITGSNNLVFDNKFIENGQGILMMNGNDPLTIGNKIKGLRFTGYLAFLDISNHFVGENHISCNGLEGIENLGQFGMFINNELSYNRDTGIKLDVNSARNLIMDNKLVCNIPANILDSGTDNNFINNIDKPCEPCESQVMYALIVLMKKLKYNSLSQIVIEGIYYYWNKLVMFFERK